MAPDIALFTDADSCTLQIRDGLRPHLWQLFVALDELADFVEICAHGHDVFWSVPHSSTLHQDVYYVLAHHKCHKLANWMSDFRHTSAHQVIPIPTEVHC